MKDWPKVWVLFPTFRRTQVSLRNLETLRQHLVYPNLHWHVCDDGSGTTDDGTGRHHATVLADAIAEFYPGVTWHEMPRQHDRDWNVGGNVNRGMRLARENGAEIVLMTFDDWALVDDLDLRPLVDLLDSCEDTGLVRLSYWVRGYAGICAQYHLPRLDKDYMWIRLIRAWSQDSYLFSMQPHIAHLRFFDSYGYYVEHKHPGDTEVAMTGQFNSAERGPDIFFPLGRRFVHVPYRHTAARQADYAAACGDEGYEGNLNAE